MVFETDEICEEVADEVFDESRGGQGRYLYVRPGSSKGMDTVSEARIAPGEGIDASRSRLRRQETDECVRQYRSVWGPKTIPTAYLSRTLMVQNPHLAVPRRSKIVTKTSYLTCALHDSASCTCGYFRRSHTDVLVHSAHWSNARLKFVLSARFLVMPRTSRLQSRDDTGRRLSYLPYSVLFHDCHVLQPLCSLLQCSDRMRV